ncbi:hypothetical protein CHS0354_001496 [Potamilus streckersoni]|uniref:Adenylyltransferase and sulfurtransferase MOCS3 homolog n=1 Tax=Potamilus streckersoni TaxID=2493646 RepID=A0AAE0VKT7_9BIVA|nr:hypothetical protein CHS0354_001496 [Potamilus streckersoni]
MEGVEDEVKRLRQIIEDKSKEIDQLKQELLWERGTCLPQAICDLESAPILQKDVKGLTNEEIRRYSRQLLLPELGVKGQQALKSSTVLIVGAGGLCCPSAIYLAAAGIGQLGIIDYDEVEISNLHRQVLHRESKIGVSKSVSAVAACQELNSSVNYVPYHLPLDSSNALQIIQQYDLVLDATDNVATRYLLNDACILAGKPLVSGSALRFEGQLTVYNYMGGPCYRCLYPKPPPPETVTNCSDGGVLGVVPGIIGCLQALEAIKILTGQGSSYSQKMLLFDALDGSFQTIKLRGRQPQCPVCGDNPSITKLIDYEQFCGAKATDKDKVLELLKPEERIPVKEYNTLLKEGTPHVLVDVRQPVELDICQLPYPCLNIPIDHVEKKQSIEKIEGQVRSLSEMRLHEKVPVIVVCRRGNDSQLAARRFQTILKDLNVDVKDIVGGLTAWAN